jgi:hypothetical protein
MLRCSSSLHVTIMLEFKLSYDGDMGFLEEIKDDDHKLRAPGYKATVDI